MTAFSIRPFHASDLVSLYRICLQTGADGGDATGTIERDILGHFFVAPYTLLEPSLAFVLTADGAPAGYIVGTADSRQFAQRMQTQWLPPLQMRYPLPAANDNGREANMIRAIHHGYSAPSVAQAYPAHLHINLLPVAQGAGQGPRLVQRLLDALRAAECTGVHLGVSPGNVRALQFYPKCGFTEIERGDSVYFGLRL